MSAKAFDTDNDKAFGADGDGAYKVAGDVVPIRNSAEWTKNTYDMNRLRDKLAGPRGPAPDNLISIPTKSLGGN